MLLKITSSFAKEKHPLMILIALYGGWMRFPVFLQGGLLCEFTPETAGGWGFWHTHTLWPAVTETLK